MECDELWTFVRKKSNKIRIWIAKCTQTKQIIAWHIGDGSLKSCKEFYSKIPEDYINLMSYSDCNSTYDSVFNHQTHKCVPKSSGLTNGIEGFNLILRQKLSRLIRKTSSFAKSIENLKASLMVFINEYNLNILNAM